MVAKTSTAQYRDIRTIIARARARTRAEVFGAQWEVPRYFAVLTRVWHHVAHVCARRVRARIRGTRTNYGMSAIVADPPASGSFRVIFDGRYQRE